MKKLTCMMLAIILSLAMIPAIGEEGAESSVDYSGNWFINTADVTAGIAVLNTDGSMLWALLNAEDLTAGAVGINADNKISWSISAAEAAVSGNWEATETGVKLIIEENTLPLTVNAELLENADRGVSLSRSAVLPKDAAKNLDAAFKPEEADYSGNWYIVMSGVTIGTVEMLKDGRMTWTAVADTVSGSWKADKNEVTLEADKLKLTLTAGENGLENTEKKILLAREGTKVAIESIMAYLSGGDLPEGMTKEDVDAFITELTAE